MTPGTLAVGFYEVTASLADHSVTALSRVAPSAGNPAGFRAPSRTAAPVGEEGDAQPPTSGDTTPNPPCRLRSIDGHAFLVLVLEFIVFY